MPKEPVHPLKVFLCHASGDKPPVRELYERLIAEGVDAWLDQEKLLPGQDWRLEIPKAVQDADVAVICLSKKSITKEGYVQKEIKFALDIAEEKPEGTIFLIPARLEDCAVPERLSRWQWVDLYEKNGFVKLLRSLKLRADAVGATIEPVSDEVPDKETERRIKQYYTEGLAAFYTEDWDRACRRFQSILDEIPDHKNAAEKLAEAERQKDLSGLYARAMQSVRSENWKPAIEILEELSQQIPVYKDVDQLLENARKQEQLRDLYAEARTLYDAQEWDAVRKVFEQISAIEPDYPDPDGLLASAHKKAVKLQRLADLNELYSAAVNEMEAEHWTEARRLLEKVHRSQAGFLETERLLRKVDEELKKEKEHSRQKRKAGLFHRQAKNHFTPIRLSIIVGGLAVLTVVVVWGLPLLNDVLKPAPTPSSSATEEVSTAFPVTPSLTLTAENTPQLLEYPPQAWVDGSTLIHIHQGEFVMGASEGTGAQVMVDLGEFWIYRTEVTNSMYSRCVAAGICTPPSAEDYDTPFHANEPVVNVTWDQADAYCQWLGARLPTEAEWEKSARGPNGNIYPWGSASPDCDLLNFNNCVGIPSFVSDYPAGGSYYGIMDMAGNVFEWAADWYNEESPGGTPAGQEGEYRSVRGSGFLSDAEEVNLANRYFLSPDDYHDDLGFRCVVDDPNVYSPNCVMLPSFSGEPLDLPVSYKCPSLNIEIISQFCSMRLQYVNIDIPEDNDGYRVMSFVGEHETEDLVCSESKKNADEPNEIRLTCNWEPAKSVANVCKLCPASDLLGRLTCNDGYELNPQTGLCNLINKKSGGVCPGGFNLDSELGCCEVLLEDVGLETNLRYCYSSAIPPKDLSCGSSHPSESGGLSCSDQYQAQQCQLMGCTCLDIPGACVCP